MADDQEEERQAILADERRCIRTLAACRRFAVKLSGASGNYATFSQNEEMLLQAFALIAWAHRLPDGSYDPRFDVYCQRAGLTPSDVRRLEKLSLLQQEAEQEE